MSTELSIVNIEDYPFITSIEETFLLGRHLCTGIIITLTWILTASQCLLHQGSENYTKDELMRDPAYYEVVTGVESTGYRKKSACKFFIVHENSSTGPTNFDYGVALIGLKDLLTQSSSVKPIQYSGLQTDIYGEQCTVIGWLKSDEEQDYVKAFKLISFNVTALYDDECKFIQEQVNITQSDQYICLQANSDFRWLDIAAAVICSRSDVVEAIVVSRIDSLDSLSIFLAIRLDYSAVWIATRTSIPSTKLKDTDHKLG
ncbi:ovochymase-2-like [Ctenocephalides felis]|uniref:ovochymase-2-like n=1 Tax=Ctenocephalides felis TaxID=7515 RepID=UPI000E6E15B9|nr:ovochymase-2-like [Ctenocephalides felis]